MSSSLAGKVAIVTGSSRSIGAATAIRLAALGASVVINYVSGAAAAQAVAESINTKGPGKAIVVQADVGSVEDNKRLVDKTLKAFGRLDIVVLNAGVMERQTLEEVTEESYTRLFDTNVKGPVFLVQAAAKHMKAGGRVIFFSSSVAHMSMVQPNYLVYTAAKGAVEQLARVLAKDLGAKGITVNTVAPGPIDTDLFRDGKASQEINFIAGLHPQKRLGTAEEVGDVVSFLVSDEARWVNGQTLMVNGGLAV
ncbi:NAD-P-binding protein [Lenzites betulinus]|nr:NAD-P-binding protein [Lenzites betulinus]